MFKPLLISASCLFLMSFVACGGSTGTDTPDGSVGDGGHGDGQIITGVDQGTKVDTFVKQDTLAPACLMRLSTINSKPVSSITKLSSAWDLQKSVAGITVDVEVDVVGMRDGTDISLVVTGQTTKPTAKNNAGKALFEKVVIGSGLTAVTFKPEATACTGETLTLAIQPDPTCAFVTPTDKVKLYAKDDKISSNDSFDYDVTISTTNASGGAVKLYVASAFKSELTPDAITGAVTFSNTVFPTDITAGFLLEGFVTAGDLTTKCSITIYVDTGKPTCAISIPGAIQTSKGPGLGPKQDELADPGMHTTVNVTTAAGVDKVQLMIDGTNYGSPIAPSGANVATFSQAPLPEGRRILQATCLNSSTGNKGTSQAAQVWVDTVAPAAVTDLNCSVTNNRKGEIVCQWKSVADSGTEASGVEKYLLRYRKNSAISAANFDDVETIAITPEPKAIAAGLTQKKDMNEFSIPNAYTFALKAVDYLGNVSDLSNLPAESKVDFNVQRIPGYLPGGQMGTYATVGDFNCDSFTDLAIGVPTASTIIGGTVIPNVGAVYIYYGYGSGLPTVPSATITGTIAASQLGASVTSLDYNGDGCSDLVAQASYGLASTNTRVYLYLGKSSFTDRSDVLNDATKLGADVVFTLPTTASSKQRLAVPSIAGDLDNDGAQDIGFRYYDLSTCTTCDPVAPFVNSVIVYGDKNTAFRAADTSPVTKIIPTSADIIITGGTTANAFGLAMTSGGKLDADNYDDVIISAPFTLVEGVKHGAVHIIKGGARAASAPEIINLTDLRVTTISGGSNNVQFGIRIAAIGDVNGDGIKEFAVTDSAANLGSTTAAGEVYVFALPLPSNPTVSNATMTISNPVANGQNNGWGFQLASGLLGGDINKDGRNDILATAGLYSSTGTGAAFLYYGATNLANRTTENADYSFKPLNDSRYSDTLGFGKSATAFLSDVNGDGYVDIVICATQTPQIIGGTSAAQTGEAILFY